MLHLDFETRSELELQGTESVGLHNYACHESTEALMLGWAQDDDEVQLWQPRLGPMSDKLLRLLEDDREPIGAYYSTFERYIFKYVLKIDLPIERFVDPQASARVLSLPGKLEDVSEILGLGDKAKNKDGKRLIGIFSQPTIPRKKKGQEQQPAYFRNQDSDPEDWEKFCKYCCQDVIAEREIMHRLTALKVFPLSERERKIWIFDQKVNDRGMPMDVKFAEKALKLASRAKVEAIRKQNELTGLENANSNTQMLAWVREQGYESKSLRKETVESALKYSETLTPLCRKVLEARKSASSTTYKKLAKALRQVSPDGRLRNLFVYCGSPRCGRWASSGGMQFHNMARPLEIFEDDETMSWARVMIYHEDYESIINWFGSAIAGKPLDPEDGAPVGTVLLVVKSCMRTAFVAGKGKRLNVCDLNAIESRVGAWMSDCKPMLDVFDVKKYPPRGRDPYLDFSVRLTQIPYEKLAADIKSKDSAVKSSAKKHRQTAKPAVLQCIYRAGGGNWSTNEYGDAIKTGLWGYAENYGVIMTQEQSHEIVRIFREVYSEIKDMWFAIENAIADVLEEGTVRVKRELGPDGCIKFDKLTRKGKHPILRIQLPSGRYLHYVDARIEPTKMPWKDAEGNDVIRPALWYSGTHQKTKQWTSITSHGGKVFENIDQGISRDYLADCLLEFEKNDLPVCGHVHDEGIVETPDDPFAPGVQEMDEIMSTPVWWADTLPVLAEGHESVYYHK